MQSSATLSEFVLSKIVLECIFNLFSLFPLDFLSKRFFFNINTTGSYLVTCDASEIFPPESFLKQYISAVMPVFIAYDTHLLLSLLASF